ncbi:MAG: hypothetical protein R2695_17660 [Acidimicrobiales bacterium]
MDRGEYHAPTQVVDEAITSRWFRQVLPREARRHLPINPDLNQLLSEVITDDRWDIVYPRLQVVIEGSPSPRSA